MGLILLYWLLFGEEDEEMDVAGAVDVTATAAAAAAIAG